MKKLLVILLITLPLITLGQRDKVKESSSKPRNVIFIVGDGMGTAQVYTSIVAQRDNNSAFLRFPYIGFSRTYSNNKYTTDSGAGGTAIVTGCKTDTITVVANTYRDGQAYRCMVTDAAGSVVYSDPAVITLKAAPVKITQQPADAIGAVGHNVTMHVAAQGDGLKYQWQYQMAKGKT